MKLTRREKRKVAKRKDRERRKVKAHNLFKSGARRKTRLGYRLP